MAPLEKQLKQRLSILFQQLELYRRYPEDFEKALGKRGIEEWLNEVLDEINETNQKLNNIKK
ncbi:MAG: hypothetical protein R2788_15420 [Saprospiraceae bacterium]